MKILVTGGNGFIGRHVQALLARRGYRPVVFDLPASVLDRDTLEQAAADCDACIHLAAHKYATLGEEQPADVADVNITGTRNVVDAFGSRVVLASTCKAADPMTCYGASKLIAERIVLNAGGRAVRLVNVLGSTGSVVDLWSRVPAGEPLPVADCDRMWITPALAARLFVDALSWPAGRYAPDAGHASPVADIARSIHPGRGITLIPPRRGDRPVERLVAEYERAESWRDGVLRIHHPADLPVAQAAALAA